MWSRFVNTTGKPGCNIPCDLFMEHLNRALGSNATPQAIVRIGKCILSHMKVCENFGKFNVHIRSGKELNPTLEKDVQKLVKELSKSSVMQHKEGRHHPLF